MKEKIDVIQIDAGWYLPDDGNSRMRGDYLNDFGKYFPKGMKRAAQDIKAEGYIPGIWLAPFLADPDSKLYQEHPEYFIQQEDGHSSYLDLSNPATMEHLRTVFRKLVDDGFDYFKIDFLRLEF